MTSAVGVALVVAALGVACTRSSSPDVTPAVERGADLEQAADDLSSADFVPSYLAPNAVAVATALAHLEAGSDGARVDRYLADIRSKTGCEIQAFLARIPDGEDVEERVARREARQIAKLEGDDGIEAVGAAHAKPTRPLTVHTKGEELPVGMISVVVATEICAPPAA